MKKHFVDLKYPKLLKPGDFIPHSLYLVILIVLWNTSFTQTKYLADNYWVENYGKKEGLPEDIVIDITQDRKGFMWLTTPYSLVRFDGYSFSIFSPREQFPGIYIHFYPGLIEDNDGIIWIGTVSSGLFSFDPDSKKFNRFQAEDSTNAITANLITSIVKGDNNDLWISTYRGLNLLTKKQGKVNIQQFQTSYPQKILMMLDQLKARQVQEIGFSKMGDFESKSMNFEIKDSTSYMVVCMGEYIDNSGDYGWIENDKGGKIWALEYAKSFHAGGYKKNRLQLDVLNLPPGKYRILFKSDDSYSWHNWYNVSPNRPELWGIQLVPLTPVLKDTIEHLIEDALLNRSDYNLVIKALFIDSENTLWSLSYKSLERLKINTRKGGQIIGEKMAIHPLFYPTFYMLQLDNERLIMEGAILDSVNKKATVGSLVFNFKTNSFELNDEGFSAVASINQKCFLRDRNKTFWMGSFGDTMAGLYISDGKTNIPHFKKIDISPPEVRLPDKTVNDQIWSLYEDRSGYIWVGSREYGLYKIKSKPTPLNYISVSLPGNVGSNISFNEIEEDGAGDIWLSGDSGGLFKYNRKNSQLTHFPRTGKGETIFFKTNVGGFFISENNQTSLYKSGKPGFKSFSPVVPDSLKMIASDDFGNYWATPKKSVDYSHSFYVLNGSKFEPVSLDSSISVYGYFRSFFFGKNGNFWFSPPFGGVDLYKFNQKTRQLTFQKKFLSKGVDVYDIYEDETGIVWLGTYDNGLIKLDPAKNSSISFSRKEGLASNFVFNILHLGEKIWVNTDMGSAFFIIKNNQFYINKELDEYISQKSNGSFFRSDFKLNYFKKMVRTSSGEIAIAATNGFIVFDPEDIRADSIVPLLQVSRLNFGGQILNAELFYGDDGPDINYDQNDLEIEYIGIHYDKPTENSYAYFLKGANKEWINAGKERIARYSNLLPGTYEFYLKSANADGIWSKEQKMFAFTILPPWWKRWWAFTIYFLMGIGLLRSYIVFRSRQMKKDNKLLEEKVNHRTSQLNQSLENLKATQTQLIQTEKMASLGELTAGIAHEIQNPLNFVNNFSEVNKELLSEMKTEMGKGNLAEAETIANDVIDNENKINHHGKRADAIVKSMLQHSKSGGGVKEPTNINAMADEYLRLAYHGLKAKDKSFNASMKTDFDPQIGTINIVPQDIGRVLLNLYNNAFYAVSEKQKQSIEGYEPTVSVSAKKINGELEIAIKDNGNGIPEKVLDKVFQPFFTTKPTGQGTGLGLSLSYDIIKAHQGKIEIRNTPGSGAEFIITLPINP